MALRHGTVAVDTNQRGDRTGLFRPHSDFLSDGPSWAAPTDVIPSAGRPSRQGSVLLAKVACAQRAKAKGSKDPATGKTALTLWDGCSVLFAIL